MQIRDRNNALSITPFLRLGFRPFFFFGVVLAIVAVPAWVMALNGALADWTPVGGWLAWHRHELLFGFVGAIVAGFLLTAVQTWTGVPGLSGKPLLILLLIWMLARAAWFIPMPSLLFILLNAVFFLLVAAQMARSVWPVRQTRNYPIVVVLLVLFLLNLMVVYAADKGDDVLQRRAVLGGLWAVGVIMTIIGARVIPFFTQRGLQRPNQVKAWPWLERLLVYGGLLVVLSYATGYAIQPSALMAVLFLLLAVGHLTYLVRWFDVGVCRFPLLWSLHVAYAWIVVACAGMLAWNMGWILNPSPVFHALTVGAMSGLILAMIARVTLGHTGRMMQPPKPMVWAFILFNLGALARVFLVEFNYQAGIGMSALLWSLAFFIYLLCYGKMLWQARVDGAPG